MVGNRGSNGPPISSQPLLQLGLSKTLKTTNISCLLVLYHPLQQHLSRNKHGIMCSCFFYAQPELCRHVCSTLRLCTLLKIIMPRKCVPTWHLRNASLPSNIDYSQSFIVQDFVVVFILTNFFYSVVPQNMDIWAWEKYYKAAQAETLQVINKIKKDSLTTFSPSN
jgi:hypothetical protein